MVVGDAVRKTRVALGLSATTVADEACLDTAALLRYEAGELEIPGDVLWRLSDILAVPFESLESPDALKQHIDALALRFKADRRPSSESVRLAVARAAGAAREYVELEEIAERGNRIAALAKHFPTQPLPSVRPIWRVGRDLALEVRRSMALEGPVSSVMDAVKQLGVLVLWQQLPADIAGYAMADTIHGPTIVLNVIGRNANELVRRFTLGHEMAHVLFDRDRLDALSSFDRYEDFFVYADESRDPTEARANAFAIHFLAPEERLRQAWDGRRPTADAVREIMETFGIGYEAARTHLANYGLLSRDAQLKGVPTAAPDELKTAEGSELWYPAFDSIPIERRHDVAQLAFRLWVEDRITTQRVRQALASSHSPRELVDLADLYLGVAAQ